MTHKDLAPRVSGILWFQIPCNSILCRTVYQSFAIFLPLSKNLLISKDRMTDDYMNLEIIVCLV